MLKVRKGGSEEIPLVQGKEQRLRFAGVAVKRYPTPKVRETHEKEYVKAVYCHPAYLTSMQSTS